MATKKECGFLILGDITGYTSFVATTELEHSQEILTELLEMLVHQFSQVLNIVKLEGDAVFAYVSDEDVSDNNTILNLIESTYVAFTHRIEKMERFTTCTCAACQAIPSLDLKFFVHYGFYVVQNVAGIKELVGSDVNILHRLTKNSLDNVTGWEGAYALLTQEAVNEIIIDKDKLYKHLEKYEHLGVIETYNIDLKKWYNENKDTLQKEIRISAEDADFKLSYTFDRSIEIIWQWMTDNNLRNRSDPNYIFSQVERPNVNTNVGATTHCAHGKEISLEKILDWRPFDYFTLFNKQNIEKETAFDGILTYQLEELEGGTSVNVYMKLERPLFWFFKRIGGYMVRRSMKKHFLKIDQLMKKGFEVPSYISLES